jgi:hypothetical protein
MTNSTTFQLLSNPRRLLIIDAVGATTTACITALVLAAERVPTGLPPKDVAADNSKVVGRLQKLADLMRAELGDRLNSGPVCTSPLFGSMAPRSARLA